MIDLICATPPLSAEFNKMFRRIASDVYKDDPIWVPQSEELITPLAMGDFELPLEKVEFLIAQLDGDSIGRAVIILPPQNERSKQPRQGWIGCFEAYPHHLDQAIHLIDLCIEKLKSWGVEQVTAMKIDNQFMGIQTAGFDRAQTILTPHHPPYYATIFEKAGFEVSNYMRTYELKKHVVARIKFKAPGYRIRHFQRNNLESEINIFNSLQNEIFSGSENYISRTLSEDRRIIKNILPIIDDELILIAEEKAGDPVGMIICIPDIYQQQHHGKMDRARIISIGILAKHRRKLLGAMLATHLSSTLIGKGYQSAEASWINDSNLPPQRLTRLFKGQLAREFALFEKRV